MTDIPKIGFIPFYVLCMLDSIVRVVISMIISVVVITNASSQAIEVAQVNEVKNLRMNIDSLQAVVNSLDAELTRLNGYDAKSLAMQRDSLRSVLMNSSKEESRLLSLQSDTPTYRRVIDSLNVSKNDSIKNQNHIAKIKEELSIKQDGIDRAKLSRESLNAEIIILKNADSNEVASLINEINATVMSTSYSPIFKEKAKFESVASKAYHKKHNTFANEEKLIKDYEVLNSLKRVLSKPYLSSDVTLVKSKKLDVNSKLYGKYQKYMTLVADYCMESLEVTNAISLAQALDEQVDIARLNLKLEYEYLYGLFYNSSGSRKTTPSIQQSAPCEN